VRFDAGATDLLDVLDAERTQLSSQDAFADGRTRTATALVGLYRALAGGWPTRVPERVQVSAR
jgi:multidrug efflux system outer membrane protein